MSVYEQRSDLNSGHLTQTEVHLYGSSRLGIFNRNRDMIHPPTGEISIFERGRKFFELSNHLGNVLVTVSDRKLQVSSGGATVDYYTADVVSATDYYPGGVDMPGRTLSSTNKYRYAFNGKEKDTESPVQYDYGFRIYDPRLVRFKSVDPLSQSYPWNSPYSYAEGDMIRSIDLDGLEKYIVFRDVNSSGELERIRILTFTDNDGNLRDNETYKNNPKLKKADVYVITQNIKTGAQVGKIKYQESLTSEQEKVFKQFGSKRPVYDVLKKDPKYKDSDADRFDFTTKQEGKVLGNDWSDGYRQDATLNLTTEVKLNFKQNSDEPATTTEFQKLSGVAKTLRLFPGSNATLTGNTGLDPGDNSPTGNSPAVLNSPATLNGQTTTTEKLMRARADAAKKLLHDNFNINNNRMKTQPGTQYNNSAGRRVDVKVTGIKL